MTVHFSEPVTGFIGSDVSVSNGSIGSFSGSGSDYSLVVTPNANGAVTVNIAANGAHDAAGNGNTAATQFTRTYDSTAPAVAISSPSKNATNIGPVDFTVTYAGADSIALTNADISLIKTGTANGTVAVTGTGTTARTVTISGITGNGTLGISVAAHTASDLAGNSAAGAGPGTTFIVDNTAPTVTISSTTGDTTNLSPIPVTVHFSKPVTGFSASGISITNGSVGSFAGSDADYSFAVTPTTNGIVTVNIRASLAQDITGNGNVAAAQFSRTYDSVVPTVVISSPSVTRTNSGSVTYTMTYTGVDTITLANADISLAKTGTANGTVAVSGTGSSRTVTISGITGDGTLGISVAAATASDVAGNQATAAGPSTTFVVDNTPPAVTISGPSQTAVLRNSGTVTFTVTYSNADAITLSTANILLNTTGTANGTVSVAGTGSTTRTVTISGLSGEGTLGLSISANTARDATGNNALAAGPSATFAVNSNAGDLNGDGIVDMTDALKALRIAVGIDTQTASELIRGDVAPLVNGAPHPDGKFDINDVVVLLKMAAGLM